MKGEKPVNQDASRQTSRKCKRQPNQYTPKSMTILPSHVKENPSTQKQPDEKRKGKRKKSKRQG